MSEKIFCLAPWSNLEILPTGSILPCCKFQDKLYDEQFIITQHSVDDYRNSKLLAQVKENFEQGQWPQGCIRCQIEEQNSIESKRQSDYKRWKSDYDKYDINSNKLLTVSIAMGNTCNLKCIICSPAASSLWKKEYQDIYNINVTSIESFRQDVINSINTIAPDLIHMDIHGGEPFLSGVDNHRKLLDFYIQTGRAKDISIHYTTNGTVWPRDEWFDRWTHFKEIDLQISIDGVGKRFEYLRFPANWNLLVRNVQQYLAYEKLHSNFRISIAHTISAYNIYYLEEFVDWCVDMQLPWPWMGRLHYPHYLRLGVWSEPGRRIIIDKLKQTKYNELLKWVQLFEVSDDSELFFKFGEMTSTHDRYRGLDFKKTFPELSDYI